MTQRRSARPPSGRLRIRWGRDLGLLAMLVALAVAVGPWLQGSPSSAASPPPPALLPGSLPPRQLPGASGHTSAGSVWPDEGQAAYLLAGRSRIQASPNQRVVPIASVAKVMTAYLVLRDHPLRPREGGSTIVLTAADVADTDRRRRQDESIVPVAAGETLTERQALQALLLPSANNIAAVLARWDAGSADGFLARMNVAARSLGMVHTRYTDPSGFDTGTISTAADQVRLVDRAMRLAVFAQIVGTTRATLPVAGTVYNTDHLLGHDGFVGVKTGSDTAAGGCFAFRAIRRIDGRQTTITGVVLGQTGGNLVAAGLEEADDLVDRIAGR